MALPPAAPNMEPNPNTGDTWENYAAEIAVKFSRSGRDAFWRSRNRVRDELENELEREREAHRNRWRMPKTSQPSANEEDNHEHPKVFHGQRRKRDDDSDDDVDEEAVERPTKRRNVSVDGEERQSQPTLASTSTSDHINAPTQPKAHVQTHAPTQPASRPVYAHKFPIPENAPWHQAIYNEVYKRVYDLIYDENYSKAYNLAYNDAFKDAMEDGGADGYHDGHNRGYEGGYRKGYKKAYRHRYVEGQDMTYDDRGFDDEEEDDDSGESTVCDGEDKSGSSEDKE